MSKEGPANLNLYINVFLSRNCIYAFILNEKQPRLWCYYQKTMQVSSLIFIADNFHLCLIASVKSQGEKKY